jgi:hypothetical protein
MSAATERSGPGKRPWLWLWGAGVVVLHLALTQYFMPLSLVLGPEPIQGDDFDVHIGQTWRVVEGLQGWGKSWVYDPKLIAGQPEGTIFDGDNKGWELWTFAWEALGASKALAFNSFVLMTFLAWPGLAFVGARMFGFSAGAAVFAAWACSLLWFFDSFAHWVWWVGMVEYGIGTCFAIVPMALFQRFVARPGALLAASTALALGVALILHPYAFFILVAPMACAYLGGFRRLGRRGHLSVLGIAAVAIAINSYWLLPAFAHWHYVLDSGFYAQAGPRFLVADFFDVLLDPSDTGVIGTRTGFRFLLLGSALAALWFWRRERDPRFAPFAAVIGVCFVLSYFSPLVPFARQIQPYRHALPLSFFSAIAAAGCFEHIVARRALVGLPGPVYALLAVLALSGAQHLGAQVAYFLPDLVPESAPLFDGTPAPIMRYGFFNTYKDETHFTYSLRRDPLLEAGIDDVLRFVERSVPSGHRVMVENIVVGERIAWKTQAEVLGGFELRNIRHSYANFFRRFGRFQVSEAVLEQYLRTFAVDYAVLERPRPDFDGATRLLQRLPDVGKRAIYRSKLAPTKLLRGSGSVHASVNRIGVRGTAPSEDVVLSYHWHEQLVCLPHCRLLGEAVPLDAVGMIRIPAPHPADFVVRLEY